MNVECVGFGLPAIGPRQVEGLLRDADRTLHALVQASPLAIQVFDLDGNVSLWSLASEGMFGWSEEEVIGHPLPYVPEDRWDEHRALCERALRGECLTGVEVRRRRKDGSPIDVRLSMAPLSGVPQRVDAIVALLEDVTQRQRREELLLRAQRLEMARRVAGQVAHDFNDLLAPLVGYPELIKMQLPAWHPATRFCDAMLEAAEQMAIINQDLLALGKRGRLEEGRVDLNLLVEQAVARIPSRPETLRIELDLARDLRPVSGSPMLLMQVLTSLLSSVRDALLDVGYLWIKTDNVGVDRPFGRCDRPETGEYVRLQVSDDGSGTPVEIGDRVLDPFFTGRRANRRWGSGLELSVVQAIVHDHRGYLDVESGMGKGTTFSVYLPALRPTVRGEEWERDVIK